MTWLGLQHPVQRSGAGRLLKIRLLAEVFAPDTSSNSDARTNPQQRLRQAKAAAQCCQATAVGPPL